MKLIPEARKAWRMFSMHVAALAVLFGALPLDQQQAVLDFIGIPASRIPAVIGLLFIAGRLVRQDSVQNKEQGHGLQQ